MKKTMVFILLVVITLYGCSAQPEQTVSVTSFPTLIKLTETVSPTTTATMTASAIPSSPTGTKTAMPTATLTSTISPTTLPTLSLDEAKHIIVELMQTNGDCTQPCFWSVYPGVTNLAEAYGLLNNLSISMYERSILEYQDGDRVVYVDSYTIRAISELNRITIDVEIFTTQNTVLTVHANMDVLDDPEVTQGDWAAFSPDAIVNAYGNPSEIKLYVGEGPNAQISYGMQYVYNDEQLNIEYWLGNWSGYAATRQVCPLQDSMMRNFDFWLGDPQGNTLDANYGYDLADVSSISINDFVQLLANDPSVACFEVNEAKLRGE